MAGNDNVFREKEKELVKILQGDLPLVPEPYREIAARLGIEEREVLEFLARWLESGVIRRFGATLRHQKAGYTANCMVAWKVEPQSRHRETGKLFASFDQVSHCYRRPSFKGWPYTLYTMVHGGSTDEIHRTVTRMSARSRLSDYRMLFSVREWKKTSMKYFSEKE